MVAGDQIVFCSGSYMAPFTIISKIYLWTMWFKPSSSECLSNVHDPSCASQVLAKWRFQLASIRTVRQKSHTTFLTNKSSPESQCVPQTGKGSQPWEMGFQRCPFSHTPLLSLPRWTAVNQLKHKNPAISLLQTTQSVQGLRWLHSFFCKKSQLSGRDKWAYFSPG